MNEWKSSPLSEVTTKIGSGATPRGGSSIYINEGIPFIRSQNVDDGVFDESGLVFIDFESARALDNVTTQEEDILLNITGESVARTCKVPKRLVGGRVNQHVAIIRANDHVNSQFLLYALIQNKPVLDQMSEIGGTRRALTKGMLEGFEIMFPPHEEQQAIAEVLSSLDDKIELLKRQNKTLEGMAEALFRQWFIEEAQDDWEEVELGDVYAIARGLSYQGAGLTNSDDPNGVPMFNLNSVLEYGGYKEEGIKFYNGAHKERHVVRPGDILVANTEQGHDHRLIGFPCLVPAKFERGILSHHLYKLTPKSELGGHFIHELLKTTAVRGQVEGCTNGSTVNMLLIDLFERVSFKRPPEEIHDAFEKQASALHQRKEKNWATIETLVKQRDTLLPKLMSGEVRLQEIRTDE